MPSDVDIALTLSILDRFSERGPGTISRGELEALRTVLFNSAETEQLREQFIDFKMERDFDLEKAATRLQNTEAELAATRHRLQEEIDRTKDAFQYDGQIGAALILLRDATMSFPDETWHRASTRILNELFKSAPALIPWVDDEPEGDGETAAPAGISETHLHVSTRFEEAVQVFGIDSSTAMQTDNRIRTCAGAPTYPHLEGLLSFAGVNAEKTKLVCDYVFMTDGPPEEPSVGFTPNPIEKTEPYSEEE